MTELKYTFAIDSATNEIKHISEAKIDNTYHYIIRGMKGVLINAFGGEIRTKHWKAKEGHTPEEIYHSNCVLQIAKEKQIVYNGITVQAHSVVYLDTDKFIQKHIKDFNHKPDLIFLDEEGKFLCIIDVKNPYKMIIPDYNKFNLNSFTIEYDNNFNHQQKSITQNFRFQHIANVESNIREYEKRIADTTNEISRINFEINNITTRRENGYPEVRKHPKQREHEQRVRAFEEAISSQQKDIDRLGNRKSGSTLRQESIEREFNYWIEYYQRELQERISEKDDVNSRLEDFRKRKQAEISELEDRIREIRKTITE